MSNTREELLTEATADSENWSLDDWREQTATPVADTDDYKMEEIFSKEDEIISRVIDLFPEVSIHRIHVIMGSVTTIYANASPDNVDDATAKVCHYLLENSDLFKEDNNKFNEGNQDLKSPNKHTHSEDTKSVPSPIFIQKTKLVSSSTFSKDAKPVSGHTFIGDTKSNPGHLFSDGAKSIPGHTCIIDNTKSMSDPTVSQGVKSVASENTESSATHTLDDNKSIKDQEDAKWIQFYTSSREIKSNVLLHPTKDSKYVEECTFPGEIALPNLVGNLTMDPFPQRANHASFEIENARSTYHTEAINEWYATFDKIEDKMGELDEINISIATEDMHCSCLWCYDDIPFVEMVKCEFGHLICRHCLKQYVRESMLGPDMLKLRCMAADCGKVFPLSEVHRAIPEDLYNKYQEHIMENKMDDVDRTNASVGSDDMHCPCLCCFEDIPFAMMVQCGIGHLFCRQCLERYVKESVFGQGKLELKCIAGDCGEVFPPSEVHRAIPEDLYNKYQERVMEEGVNCADLDNFVRCKTCPYGVVMDQDEPFFMCPTCNVAYCRKCQRSHEDHRGASCIEVEVKGETQIRTRYEEKMAEAKIRTCGRCKTRFTKDKGCNHIQCRCGASMCYVCRVPNVNKKRHYCRHVRESGGRCYQCDKTCYLYTDVNEDDEMAIIELKSEADYVRKMEGYTDNKEIGAPGSF